MMSPVQKHLNEVADIIAGTTGFGSKAGVVYHVVQPNNFTETGQLRDVPKQYRADELSESQLLTPGDILVKRLNPSFVHVADESARGMSVSQNLFIVRPHPDIDPFYLGYLLEQKEIIGQVEHMTGNTAIIKAVSIKKLSEIILPIIPIAEQKAVGELWKLSRYRKRLLEEYSEESDRLMSIVATKIITGGGKTK